MMLPNERVGDHHIISYYDTTHTHRTKTPKAKATARAKKRRRVTLFLPPPPFFPEKGPGNMAG